MENIDDVESQQQPVVPHGGEMYGNNHSGVSVQNNNEEAKKFTLYTYLQHPNTFIDRKYHKDSLKGFLSILKSISRTKELKSSTRLDYTFSFLSISYIP